VPTDARTQKRRFLTSSAEGEIGAVDPHIWMSPISVIDQASIIAEELKKLDPDNSAVYEKNLFDFTQEMRELDSTLTRMLEPLRGETLLVYHPTFGYFADRYGLVQKAVEAGGKEPTPKQLEKLIETAKKEKVALIFVQPQFSDKSSKAIADAIGARVVTINSLDENYLENLLHIAETLGLLKPEEISEP
jgi:zinc transport system substrate-binding protein